jgi:hypothetical protein
MFDFGAAVVLGIGDGYSSDVLLGLILAMAAPFLGLYLFVKLSKLRRSLRSETVGPHVVEPVQRQYGDQPYTCYRCKYCKKEFERKEFFLGEDCEDFEAMRR